MVAPSAFVVEDPGVRRLLAAAYVVWLDAPVEVLAARFADGDHRPDYGETVAVLNDHDSRRRPWFAALADLRLDAAASPGDLAAAAEAALRARGIA